MRSKIFFLLGLFFFIGTVYHYVVGIKMEIQDEYAYATVLEVKDKSYYAIYSYDPVLDMSENYQLLTISYEWNGNRYTREDVNPPYYDYKYKKGDTIAVRFNSKDPYDFRYEGVNADLNTVYTFSLGAIILLLLGIPSGIIDATVKKKDDEGNIKEITGISIFSVVYTLVVLVMVGVSIYIKIKVNAWWG